MIFCHFGEMTLQYYDDLDVSRIYKNIDKTQPEYQNVNYENYKSNLNGEVYGNAKFVVYI